MNTLMHKILTGTTSERDALEFEQIVEHLQAGKFWYFLFGILLGLCLGSGVTALTFILKQIY